NLERFLQDYRRGNRAESDPDSEERQTHHVLQRVEFASGTWDAEEASVGHEINHPFRHQSGDAPSQRPKHDTDELKEVSAADFGQARHHEETDKDRRQGIA